MSIVEADQIPADLPTASASCSIPGRAEDSGRDTVIALPCLQSPIEAPHPKQ